MYTVIGSAITFTGLFFSLFVTYIKIGEWIFKISTNEIFLKPIYPISLIIIISSIITFNVYN